MWVSKKSTKQVPGPRVAAVVSVGVRVRMEVGVDVRLLAATVVVAGLRMDLRVRGGSGAVFGAVPLAHEVRDAEHSRVEDQVAPAGLGCLLCAGGVSA